MHHTAPTTFPAKGDALAFLSTVEAATIRGRWVDPRAGSTRFRDYAERWLKIGGSRATMRESTRAKYRGLLDRHLLPTFGKVPLSKIRPSQVAAWHSEPALRHAPTAAGAYRLLATIYNSAIREDLIVRSPCRVEGAGREQAVERPTATISECQRAVDATPAPYRVALLLGSWGQLRRGEVLALQRGDVDLSAGSVRVQRGWTLTENGQTVLGPPKSDAGKRTLFLPPHVQVAIAGHLEDFVGPQRDAWLFPTVGDELVHPRKFARVWERAREAAGHTDPRFHDLRHSGLTWVAQAGATTAELMRRAGHASPAAALRYQHAADERDKSLAEALGRMAASATTTPRTPRPARRARRPRMQRST